MKKIVVLGSSVAGVKVLEAVRVRDKESELTIISFDEHYPYDRDKLASVLAKEIPLNRVYVKPKDFYEKERINVLLEKKVSRINLRRKRIFTEVKETFDYDILVLSDLPQFKFPEIKGNHKTGIYSFEYVKDIDSVVKTLPLVDTVVIQSNSYIGFQFALACLKRGKEVVLISTETTFLPSYMDAQTSEAVIKFLEGKGLRIILNNSISELLGDADVKAIRFNSGKVIGAQLVFLDDISPDYRVLGEDSGLAINKRIEVNGYFQSHVDSIYACDKLIETQHQIIKGDDLTAAVLADQGRLIAAHINKEEAGFMPILDLRVSSIPGFSMALATPAMGFDQSLEAPSKDKRLIVRDHVAVGCVLMNADPQTPKWTRLVENRIHIEGLEGPLMDDECSYDHMINRKRAGLKPIVTDPLKQESPQGTITNPS